MIAIPSIIMVVLLTEETGAGVAVAVGVMVELIVEEVDANDW